MKSVLRAAMSVFMEFLFPRRCVLCGRSLKEEPGRPFPLCASCEAGLPDREERRCKTCGKPLISEMETCMRCRDRTFYFDSARPIWLYRGRVQDLVLAFKAGPGRALAVLFCDRLETILRALYPEAAVVPVPFRRKKKRSRGWDPVEDLARELKRRGIPVRSCLKRLSGPSQKTLDYPARLSNLSGKIRIAGECPVPERVVLLDDVLTTGATLSECARILKAHGAERVDAVVVAAD